MTTMRTTSWSTTAGPATTSKSSIQYQTTEQPANNHHSGARRVTTTKMRTKGLNRSFVLLDSSSLYLNRGGTSVYYYVTAFPFALSMAPLAREVFADLPGHRR